MHGVVDHDISLHDQLSDGLPLESHVVRWTLMPRADGILLSLLELYGRMSPSNDGKECTKVITLVKPVNVI